MKSLLDILNRVMHRFNLEDLFYRLLQIIIILIVAKIGLLIANKLISRVFKVRQLQGHFEERRANTLEALLRSLIRYLIYFITGVTVLQLFNVPVGSVLTTAGIAGVAVAFGAQSLVRDVITGFFILMEDQFQVGDRVSIAEVTGIVEEIGLRVTKVRDVGGQLHIIPNGKIEKVTNFDGSAMLAQVDIPVAYDNDLTQTVALLEDCLHRYNKIRSDLVEPAFYQGIQGLTETTIVLRVWARTRPERQWAVEREIRQAVTEAFAVAGVKRPAPRNEKSG